MTLISAGTCGSKTYCYYWQTRNKK